MEKIAAAALTMDESPAPCPCDCDCSDDSWIDVAWGGIQSARVLIKFHQFFYY
jgi:hypothetical protein